MILLLLSLDLDDLAPRALRETAVIVARDGERAAVVDRAAALWVGEGRLTRVATLAQVPDGLELGAGGLLLWSVTREGLWTETQVELRDARGRLSRTQLVEGPASGALALDDGFALAFPSEILLIAEGGAREVPLPLLEPELLSASEGTLIVHGEGGASASVDLATGCARGEPGEGPLARWLQACAALGCAQPDGAPGPQILTPAQAVQAEQARQATIRAAVAARSPALLAGLWVRGRDAIQALAPGPAAGKARFTTLTGDRLSAPSDTFGPDGALILQDIDDDLQGWTDGPLAPGCHARVLLAPASATMAARMDEAREARKQAHDRCADQVRVLPVGLLPDSVQGPTLRYASPSGDLLARRLGPLGPAQVRLDIASLTPRGDPLTELGQLPLYNPEWIVSAAKADEMILDVDGSALIAASWELLRVDPSVQRVARMALPGPVEGLSVRKNGTVDAVVGGQRAVIDLDHQTARYYDPAPASAPAPAAVEPGPWRIAGSAIEKLGPDGKVVARTTLPLPPRVVARAGSGAVVQTALGLFGLDADGKLSWKLPDAGAWVVTRGYLLVGTSSGVAGFRLAR